MRRSPPPPALVGKILERQEHAVEEPGAELTEAVVALERRQVGDAEEFPVLGEEGEESLRKSGCGIATLPRRVGDEDSELTAPASVSSSISARTAASTSGKYW